MSTIEDKQSVAPVRYRTAAQWLHDLGDVPLERIVFDPWPGTATEEDVVRLNDHENRLCELVNGTLLEKPMGFIESMVAAVLIRELGNFIRESNLGIVAAPDGMVQLTRGLVRIPDVSFVSFARLPGGKIPNEPILALAPDLAVEVLSKTNTPGEMGRKLREYLDAGVRLVWIIDPSTRTAMCYTDPEQVTKVESSGMLDGGDVLPGLRIPLSELFANLPN